ncbi:hypothetical protein DFQ28_008794 [Apophysomyces sp. BC1034]|nr:hypothetical protein DFQ28_008794 [Apophysomyces sp. BC1034]
MVEDLYLYLYRKRELEQRQEKAISQKGSSNKRKEKGDSSSKNDEGRNSEDPSDEEHESDDGTESQQRYIPVATTSLRKMIRPEVDYSTMKRLLEETQETNSRVMNTMVIHGDVYKFIGYSDSVDNWDIFTFRQFQNMFYSTIGNVETQQIPQSCIAINSFLTSLFERDDDAVTSSFQAHSVKELYTAANNMYQGALYQ